MSNKHKHVKDSNGMSICDCDADLGVHRRAPLNTTMRDNADLYGFLVASMGSGGTGQAIVEQEKASQTTFVHSDTLPVDINPKTAQAGLEAIGAKFHGPVPNDKLFQYVDLPPGWKKVATSHDMWSDLLDAKGRKRGAIFFKGAYYDRAAYMSMACRYSVGRDEKDRYGTMHIKDSDGTVLHTVAKKLPADPEKQYAVEDTVRAEAKAWLKEHYPDYENPCAYWD